VNPSALAGGIMVLPVVMSVSVLGATREYVWKIETKFSG
jgi:hypothetical protein